MQTVHDVFEKLGGTGALARLIAVKRSAASEMKRRQSIPVRYWPQLIVGARSIGVEITTDALVNAHLTKHETAQ